MSDPKFIALTPELHDYVVRNGSREDEALAASGRATAALGDIAVMQISPDQGAFMTMLVRLIGARRAIELGTFTGYSAICIARGLGRGRPAVACELDPSGHATAGANFAAAGVADRIEIRIGPAARDARARCPERRARSTSRFIDADKTAYPVLRGGPAARCGPAG